MNSSTKRRLALFDLDDTLLAGDSDHAWGEFLIASGLVDEPSHRRENDRFHADYVAGRLDIHAWLAFTLAPLRECSATQREALLAEFLEHWARPMVHDAGLELVREHRWAGDFCMIVTATNDLIARPVAELFAIDELLATEAEIAGGAITGRIRGTPCFQQGKASKLAHWLAHHGESLGLAGLDRAVFYSDSANDLPLLELVGEPVAVHPDERLASVARQRGWKIISLRGEPD